MTDTKQHWGLFQAVILMLIVSTVVSVVRVAFGERSLIDNPIGQVVVCGGLGMWAYAYYKLQETDWRIAFGIIQILAATWSNLYQLDKLGNIFSEGTVTERWTFIGGAIVVLAHGIKDVAEGVKKRKSRLNPVTPQSSES